ncbi:MAG: transcriptional repressor [Lachnospiraceae bacterium]|nr:transcriptional repressor [Lachnospiraceae bacterium]
MNIRPKYKTKQREILLSYLQAASGGHITASDVCEYFRKQGASIGQATVYRQLESLVDEGLVNKYIIDSNSPACFEYVGKDAHEEGEVCFHCKCEKCGKLIHLHCDELEAIKDHLSGEHHFQLDPLRTVFYGICEECRKALSSGDAPAGSSDQN